MFPVLFLGLCKIANALIEHGTQSTWPNSRHFGQLTKARMETTSEKTTNDHTSTTFCPRFTIKKITSQAPKSRNNPANKPNRTNENLKTHHSSPQKPKTCFIHTPLVGPLLLT